MIINEFKQSSQFKEELNEAAFIYLNRSPLHVIRQVWPHVGELDEMRAVDLASGYNWTTPVPVKPNFWDL